MENRITSRDNERVKYTAKLLAKPAFCREQGQFVAEGEKLCLDAAAAGLPCETLYLTDDAAARWPALATISAERVLIHQTVAEKLSGMKSPQGVFGVFGLPSFDETEIDPNGHYLALEEVQDPANVGAVLRSAAAFGFSGVLLTPGCADPLGQKAMRASMGAAFRLPAIRVEDLPSQLSRLGKDGMATIAAALYGAGDLMDYQYTGGGLVLVVGNEGNGLSQPVIDACGAVLRIPMQSMESLNAAVAASVLMWELWGRRNG